MLEAIDLLKGVCVSHRHWCRSISYSTSSGTSVRGDTLAKDLGFPVWAPEGLQFTHPSFPCGISATTFKSESI